MKQRILVVDDEIKIREMICKYGVHEGFEIVCAKGGYEAIELFEKNNFDLIILDVMMPDLDGFKTLEKIKKQKDVPCIFLTALSQEYDRIYGFDIGADDYVCKPFSLKELFMRIKAILNRTLSKENKILEYKTLKLDLEAHILKIDDDSVILSLKEFELLQYFLKNANKVLEREVLITKIWGYDYEKDERTLDTHIKLLRKKMKQYGKNIVTHRGIGYRFEE